MPEAKVEKPQRATKPVVVNDDDVLGRARQVAEAYREKKGKAISRDALRRELGVSTNRPTDLLRQIKQPVAA